jgi:hypothetical protein
VVPGKFATGLYGKRIFLSTLVTLLTVMMTLLILLALYFLLNHLIARDKKGVPGIFCSTSFWLDFLSVYHRPDMGPGC